MRLQARREERNVEIIVLMYNKIRRDINEKKNLKISDFILLCT